MWFSLCCPSKGWGEPVSFLLPYRMTVFENGTENDFSLRVSLRDLSVTDSGVEDLARGVGGVFCKAQKIPGVGNPVVI